jgi:O-antigen ligase
LIATLAFGRRPRGLLGRIDWAIGQILSFEFAFVLFLYSNELKLMLRGFPFPVDETVLFGVLAVGAGAIVVYREGIYLRGVPVLAAAFLFIAYATVTVSWTPSRILWKESLAYLYTFTLFSVLAGACIIANRRERAVRFFAFALGVALLMAAFGLGVYIRFGDFRRWAGWQDLEGRAYLAFGHTVVNGAGIAIAIAIFSRLGSVRQAAGALMFAACGFFLLVGGGRGPFLGAVVAALVALATRPPAVGRGRIELPYATVAATAMFALFVGYVGYLVATGGSTTTLNRFARVFSDVESGNTRYLSGADRLQYWQAAWAYFTSAPVFGHGLNSFSVMFRQGAERAGSHPHNIFLQILCEMGVVGLAFWLVFFWTAFRNASFRRLRRDPLMVCVVLFLITSSMSALFGRDIVGVRKFFFAVSLMALRPPSGVGEEEDEEETEEEVAAAPPLHAPTAARVGTLARQG